MIYLGQGWPPNIGVSSPARHPGLTFARRSLQRVRSLTPNKAVYEADENNGQPWDGCDHPLTSRRAALEAASAAALNAAWTILPGVAHAETDLDVPKLTEHSSSSRVREARMVMRVLALRGSVPQQWVSAACACSCTGCVSTFSILFVHLLMNFSL